MSIITLKPEQQEWLAAHVERGDFPSVEEAARQLIDDRITELELEADDLAWAKPYVDEALAAVERGEFVTLEEHREHMTAVLAACRTEVFGSDAATARGHLMLP